MVGFKDVAIFVLATTRGNDRFGPFSQFEMRLAPLAASWGSYFPHLYAVFGRNPADIAYLKEHCSPHLGAAKYSDTVARNKIASDGEGRRLKAHIPQTPYINRTDLYNCPVKVNIANITSDKQTSSSTTSLKSRALYHYSSRVDGGGYDLSIKSSVGALFVHNCTGEYFGWGPACRCQEAMRFFYKSLPTARFFMFMDDDVYIRPFAFVEALRMVQGYKLPTAQEYLQMQLSFKKTLSKSGKSALRRKITARNLAMWNKTRAAAALVAKIDSSTANQKTFGGIDKPLAVIHGEQLRTLSFSARARKCYDKAAYAFTIAQPAIINKAAMDAMRDSVINFNSLTQLQLAWGGTHDILLGLLLWMHQIPTATFAKSFLEVRIYRNQDLSDQGLLKNSGFNNRMHLIFHKVRIANSKNGKDDPSLNSWPAQIRLARALGDLLPLDRDAAHRQSSMGRKFALMHVYLMRVSNTSGASMWIKRVQRNGFDVLRPSDCIVA
jgi:hypothetical protein